jgi:glycosyltransferase involved in cell wall biosynthesis
MRLLMVTPTHGRGGAEEYLLAVAKAAVDRGWAVDAALPSTPATDSVFDDLRAAGVHPHPAGLRAAPQSRWQIVPALAQDAYWTMRLIRRCGPDRMLLVLPAPQRGLGTMLAAAATGTPCVVTFQVMTSGIEVSPVKRWLYRRARSRRQRWLAVSDNNKELVARSFRVDPATIHRVYNGVEIPPVAAATERERIRDEVRRELGLPDRARIVISVGRLTDQKGHRYVVPALGDVVREHPHARFLWAGAGPNEAALRSQIVAAGLQDVVLLLGHRTDVDRLLRAAELLLFPSVFEGYPFALMEAMAAGLPVVSSRLGPMREVVTDRVTGLTFDPGDADEVARRLNWALAHPAEMEEMAGRGRALVSERYTRSRMLQETFAVLQAA